MAEKKPLVNYSGNTNEISGGDSLQTNITGNAATVTNGVYTSGNQTIAGIKTFSSEPVITPLAGVGDRDVGVDSTGKLKIITGGSGSGETVVSTITQANAFSNGNVVYDNAGTWELAKADAGTTLATHMVVNVSGTQFDLVSIGKATVTSHGFGTAGQILYTSATTAGAVTTTEPGVYSNPIGIIIDANTINVLPWRASMTVGTSLTTSNLCRIYTGIATITNADVTVNLPFDWSGGYLYVTVSNTLAQFTGGFLPKYETSYDALTNAGVTSDQMLVHNVANSGYFHSSASKTLNARGIPKSATATSFTLDNDGTTAYASYMVLAPYSQTITFGSNQIITSSGAGAPTSTPTNIGDRYLDTTAVRWYTAKGTASSADWLKDPVYASGTVTVTAGGGDVTVTLPWDWSGGYLEIIRSDSTSQWAEPTTANALQLQTSYDALTNANYTTGHIVTHSKSTTADNAHSGTTKTDNFSGLPKSATSTTFVLDDGGVTEYIKYFVWA